MDIKTFINALIKYSTLTLLGILLFPALAHAQTPVFPGPPLVGTLAQRPSACSTLLQEYFATDNTTLYYATVAGGSCTWVAVPTAAATGITSTGSPANTYLAGFSGATTISGTANATLDASGNLVAATVTAASLTTGHCVQASTGGLLTTVSGACGSSSGTLTATGSPVSGNIAAFSGGTSLTNSDLSGDVTTSGTLAATVVALRGATLPTIAASTGFLYDTAGTLSLSTSAAGLTSGTLPAARLPNPSASTLGGIQSLAAVSHNWINTISTSGVPSATRPACADLSDSAASCSTDATNASNLATGSVPAARLPAPTASTLGGVKSLAAVSHLWINTISTGGAPAATQPAAADLSDTATSGNYLRANGTSFISAAIQSGDLPATIAANTSGTAANLSGTPALPNGTTATTQAPADNSTNIATTAYADAEAGAQNPLTTIGDVWGGGISGAPARIAGGLTGQWLTSANASASAFASPGVAGRVVSGTTDTILGDSGTALRDRGTVIQYTSASSIAVTLPAANASGFSSNFIYSPFQTGVGTQTITPTTSTINGQTTLQIIRNAWCSISSPDNTNYLARCATYIKAGTGLTPTFNADGSTTFALSSTVVIPTGATGTTQSAGDDSTKIATTAYADTAVANRVQVIQLTSQYTNSTVTPSNVAGGNTLAFTAAANTNYTAECHLYYKAAASGGFQIEWTGPASPTNVVYGFNVPKSASTFANGVVTAGYGNLLGSGITTVATDFAALASFSLQNGSNAGTVNLLAASTGPGQLTIEAGSYCKVNTN